jgi:acetyltransferase
MLARFTQGDYDREIAMVAIDEGGGAEKMIGVSQVFIHPDGTHGEFAILVGDPWHGQGVGANLLAHVLRIAKERGLADVWGVVLRDMSTCWPWAKSLALTLSGRRTAWSAG